MSRPKPVISLTPVIARRKVPAPSYSGHKKRLEAEKKALLALEQSLRLQAYTIRLPRERPLFSGKDVRRCVFPSAPAVIIRIQNGK